MRFDIAGRKYETEAELRERLRELDAEHPEQRFPRPERDEWNEICGVLAEFEARHERLRGDGRGFAPPRADPRRQQQRDDQPRSQTREAGLRAIERHRDQLEDEAGERLEELVREHDPLGVGARYLAAVGDPAYDSRIRQAADGPDARAPSLRPAEVEAVRAVSAIQAERALCLTGASGGFAVPFALDPTVMLTSDGALNPLREISRVETIAVDEWRGVSSAGVTAAFAAEATAATDNAPTLAQPTISTEKAQAFIPFSIEVGMDWPGLRDQMAALLSDAKETLEATKFVLGSGTNEPQGVLVGLSTTQKVHDVSATATFAVGDAWLLKAAIPARYIPGASILANPATLDSSYRFVGGGSTEPPLMPSRDGSFAGLPAYESSAMVATTTTGSKIVVGGDFKRGYVIVDRIGLQIELVPHLFDATTAMPTGQRGLYAYWRVGAEVVNQNALRFLETK